MKELVINKDYELQLPHSYVDVERKEMEIVDGGWTIITTAGTIRLILTGAETNTLINYNTPAGNKLLNAIIIGTGDVRNIIRPEIAKAFHNQMINYNKNNSGASFVWTLNKITKSYNAPKLIDNY